MVKEEWFNSEGKPMSELFSDLKCSICKSPTKEIIMCNQEGWHWFGKGIMCKKCAKKCPVCKKFFCDKHLKKHDCLK
jgi:hypothetical protein